MAKTSKKKRSKQTRREDVPVPRVVRLPHDAWERLKEKGQKEGTSAQHLLHEAVEQEMDRLVRDLDRLGVTSHAQPDKRVRVSLSKTVLKRLQAGRRKTGLAGTQLMGVCLARFVNRKRRVRT